MTQILNNMKRKEKKGLFYLIGIAIMVAIMGISCSANATAPADFSETEDFIEVPAPEVKPEQTPTAPVLTIHGNTGAIQFEGKTFTDSTSIAKVKTIGNESVIEFNGIEYGCGINTIKGDNGKILPKISYRLSLRNGKYLEDGTATFTADGYLDLSIGGKSHKLKLVK